MQGDKTIDEAASVDGQEDVIDPEEQETVMFGQRSLFRDVDIAGAAKRQQEASAPRPGTRQQRRGHAGEPADTIVTAPPVEIEEQTTAKTANGTRRRRARGQRAEPSTPASELEAVELNDASEAVTIEAALGARARAEAPVASGTTVAKGPRKAPGGEASERHIAERRPADGHRERGERPTSEGCSCRMCGRNVRWPKARRFRGRKKGHSGFRCDTCGNVFCAEHAIRASRFLESLVHHGRFRCLLCELGNMAKQAERMRARGDKAKG